MTFELTDSLKNDILFAMEDQNSQSVLDAEKKAVVKACFSGDGIQGEVAADEEKRYSLPAWTSDDGFSLMEQFAESCRSPFARSELKRCLQSRRGVFRNFKSIVKAYPEVEKRWFAYKNKVMLSKVTEWYSRLRESWGLEALEEDDSSSETEYLVQDDFEFVKYDSVRDKECVDRAVEAMAEEYESQLEGELGASVAELWRRQSGFSGSANKYGFVCYSHSDEFLGCFLVSFCPSSAKKTVLATDFYVVQNFRGLGIGRELLHKCLVSLAESGIQQVLIAGAVIPESMESLLAQFSFKRIGSGYVANLF